MREGLEKGIWRCFFGDFLVGPRLAILKNQQQPKPNYYFLKGIVFLLMIPVRLAKACVVGAGKSAAAAGKGVIVAGKGAAIAGQKGAELAKDAATRAVEYEAENKVLQGAAVGILERAKKGATLLVDSLGLEEDQSYRIWTSADGTQTIEARLVAVSETAVRLQKPDGSLIDVQKSHLSPADLSTIAGPG